MLQRLWNMSPREFVGAVRRRVWDSPRTHPSWHTVRGGPLAGAQLMLAPEAMAAWQQMADGTYDEFLFEAMRRFLDLSERVCWDVGAHFGYHALGFAALAGSAGKVIAIEPNPANLERMQLNLARNPELGARISVLPCALGDQVAVKRLVASDDVEGAFSSGSHLAGADTPHGHYGPYGSFEEMEVAMLTIDNLVFQQGMPAPDVLKIDVEGAESMVLRGGEQYFRDRRPLLLLEIHHILQMFSVQQMLAAWGYGVEVLDREHAEPGRCFILARHPKGGAL